MIVIGTRKASETSKKFFEIAQEIAHSWYLYGGGDSEIVYDYELCNATKDGEFVNEYKGNLVLLGSPYENLVTRLLLRKSEGIYCVIDF